MADNLHIIIMNLYYFILGYFGIINTCYVILFVLSIRILMKRYKLLMIEDFEKLSQSQYLPPISILVPCYNEQEGVVNNVHSLLRLNYPALQLIVVNDGSKDHTMQNLKLGFDLTPIKPPVCEKIKTKKVRSYYRSSLYSNLIVVDKENGGKSDTLNAGLNICRTPFFVTIDADTLVVRDALLHMVRPVMSGYGTATGIMIGITNGCRVKRGEMFRVRLPENLLSAIQVVEYIRAFLFSRLGWNYLGGSFIISGAYGLFNTRDVLSLGGYVTNTVGEDIELTVRLHHELRDQKKDCNIQFIPDPDAWTEAPHDLISWRNQRERWHRGLIDTVVRHRDMFLNPQYGAPGMISFPFYVFGEMLHPILECLGYIVMIIGMSLGYISLKAGLLFFLFTIAFTISLSIFAIVLEEATFKRYGRFSDILKMIFCAVIENIGYRQLYMIWKLQAFYTYAMGNTSWGNMSRSGFHGNER